MKHIKTLVTNVSCCYQDAHVFRLRTFALLTLFSHPLLGGVVLDGSFGTHGALPGPNFMIPASFGKQVGGNLFQSFSQFDLTNHQSATFTGPNNVHNILSRVTSGSPSSIDGTINSSIPGANLFFLDPAGVMFGHHAQVNVSGSFAVSTANYLKLADGGKFNTSLGGHDVLTSAPVSAFGFLNTAPAAVSVNGTNRADSSGNIIPGPGLTVSPGKSFSIVAGDIAINRGYISGLGSRVNLMSVKSAGEVQLDATNINSAVDVSQFTVLGTINLTNLALIDTSGPGGGPAVIRGGNLCLDNSQVSSETTGDNHGGAIDIALVGDVKIINSSSISADTSKRGHGGDVSITANSLLVDGGTDSFASISTDTYGSGNAGNVTLHAGDVNIIDDGYISADTLRGGHGGDVSIIANSLLVDGGTDFLAFISTDTYSSGFAGDVILHAGDVKIINGGSISADTLSRGHSGDVSISANSLLVDEGTISTDTHGSGNAGDVTLHAGDVKIINTGSISADTSSGGHGGDVNVSVRSIFIDNARQSPDSTGIFAEARGTGNGGTIAVNAGGVLLRNGGSISAESFTSGTAGSVRLDVGMLSLESGGIVSSANLSSGPAGSVFIQTIGVMQLSGGSSVSTSAIDGGAGTVTVNAPDLRIASGGEISSSTFGSGSGGDVIIHAGSLSIDSSATPGKLTGIDAETDGSGNAGNLDIAVDNFLTIVGRRSHITADTFSSGNGGSITLHAGSLSIDGLGSPKSDAGIFAASNDTATGNAGNLSVTVDNLLSIVRGGLISASTYSSGKGGDVMLYAGSLSIDGSGAAPDRGTGITADTLGRGDAGIVSVQAHALTLTRGGVISSSTESIGKGGSVTVTADSILIRGAGVESDISASAIPGSSGNAGTVSVYAHKLMIMDDGEISSGTGGTGNAGNVNVTADSLLIDGAGASGGTGIFADTGFSGNAGNVSVQARSMTLTGGGQISSQTFSAGMGGSVTVAADSLFIDGAGAASDIGTGIFATADVLPSPPHLPGTGVAGSVSVQARSLTLIDDGEISSSSFTSAAAGSVRLNLRTLTMDTDSSISSFNDGTGEAGNVSIRTVGPVKLKHGARISTSSKTNDAGSIDIISGGEIKLKDDSSITVSAGHNGGDINIKTPDLVYLLDSSITATAGSKGRSGAGGNITIEHPQFIVLQNSFISANATIGQGGNIKLVSDFLFNSDLSNNNITATGTTNGTVNITAPELDLGSELITLPASLLSAENQLQERCTALLRGDFSSFISIGRGGTEPAPEELQSTF